MNESHTSEAKSVSDNKSKRATKTKLAESNHKENTKRRRIDNTIQLISTEIKMVLRPRNKI